MFAPWEDYKSTLHFDLLFAGQWSSLACTPTDLALLLFLFTRRFYLQNWPAVCYMPSSVTNHTLNTTHTQTQIKSKVLHTSNYSPEKRYKKEKYNTKTAKCKQKLTFLFLLQRKWEKVQFLDKLLGCFYSFIFNYLHHC